MQANHIHNQWCVLATALYNSACISLQRFQKFFLLQKQQKPEETHLTLNEFADVLTEKVF